MREIIEIKRKEFEVLEQIGFRSFKVERKGKIYFLKKFDGDKKGFDELIKNQEIIRNCGITIPKIYLWDKNSLIFVTDFIEGIDCFSSLCEKDFDEELYSSLFNLVYFCKKFKHSIDFDPRNFIYSDGKLYYIAYKVSDYDSKKNFLDSDLPLWFFTKQFVKFAHSLGISVDEKRLLSDAAINKKMTLIGIKYFR